MNSNTHILSYMIFFVIPMAQGSMPGTYFWRPRLGIDLAIPTTEPAPGTINQPTKDNIREGTVVMVDGYQMGLTMLGLATGMSALKPYPHLNPSTAYYYTNVYRWALRYLRNVMKSGKALPWSTIDACSMHVDTFLNEEQKNILPKPDILVGSALFFSGTTIMDIMNRIPFWAGGNGGHLTATTKTWRRRFYYMDEMVPEWLKYLVPYVPKESWDQHDLDQRRFKAHSESAFGKHYRYPTKQFRNFISFETKETLEVMDSMISRQSP